MVEFEECMNIKGKEQRAWEFKEMGVALLHLQFPCSRVFSKCLRWCSRNEFSRPFREQGMAISITQSSQIKFADWLGVIGVAQGRAWGWGLLKGSRMCSWEANKPIPMHDAHSLVHKFFAELSPANALERELLHNTMLLYVVGPCCFC